MVINIVPDALAHSDWDAHFDPWTDGPDRRAAGPAYTQWLVNLLVEAHRSGTARGSPLHLRTSISFP